ncbi:excinuclease ABC, A subunit [Streptomyces viridochromogenes DSM 40736]|uniref:UvrABC system protein A n=1 Tax=Streptomyces viridochromogenes (strain DSM 40736 / JCM 4977 / BCRC 1201 / Tue 494) TaxID=591159 RepID=D9X6X9_STRVT|nr:excinuclease ABC subunit UvrA [Streptomyces viridochromogenes]EFL34046.1 excinuclease ABC, A subunit [Streptomyces viridochromogenes DSM 40736]
MDNCIRVTGARLHNLRNVSLSLPKNKLVVLTGLSGSGKSTLAFDTLHQEGQRQYLESLGMVTGWVSKPAVDSISGLSPSISVDQHLTNRSPRSTVGTVTEVFTYLRLLWSRIGSRPCPGCGKSIPPSYANAAEAGTEDDDTEGEQRPCPHCGTLVPELVMGAFSFNKPAGACPDCTGLGEVIRPDVRRLVDGARSVAEGAVRGWNAKFTEWNLTALRAAGRHYGFTFDADRPFDEMDQEQRDLLLHGAESPEFRRHFPDTDPPATVSAGRFEGVATALLRRYSDRADDPEYREKAEQQGLVRQLCPGCEGVRLRPESRAVTVHGLTIVDAARLPLTDLGDWLTGLRERSAGEEWLLVEPVVVDLEERVRRLLEVGVGYLTLGQSTPSLSAGETQRLRLAALLGSGLTGVLYVLDEPTIGLHPSDTARLVGVLKRLRDLGNTVLVVEHDLDVLRAADHVVDVGPGAGRDGGRIVATGTPEEVGRVEESVTGAYLSGRLPAPASRARGDGDTAVVIRGARAHNLKDLTVRIPLNRLVTVTGPSGSGKSTLLLDILGRAAGRHFHGAGRPPAEHDGIDGWEHLSKAVLIDQEPIGRVPRSNAATYSDVFTPIREVFATSSAGLLTAGRFSFNVPGGRCERCEGAGVLTVRMHFLPAVQVRCPACRGRRFRPEVLAVRYEGYDIAEVLEATVDEALGVFRNVSAVAGRLRRMADVGLGYLPLGQPAPTLSGGEAQRLKLAKELGRRTTGRTLYVLDEPTTGLHAADTARLLEVLQRLVDAGHSVITIEHNVDVMRASDWLIDLGPVGGAGGGRLVGEGTPQELSGVRASRTGGFLAG